MASEHTIKLKQGTQQFTVFALRHVLVNFVPQLTDRAESLISTPLPDPARQEIYKRLVRVRWKEILLSKTTTVAILNSLSRETKQPMTSFVLKLSLSAMVCLWSFSLIKIPVLTQHSSMLRSNLRIPTLYVKPFMRAIQWRD